jgi:hypothetical protein
VAGCCECGDEPSGSCATELVSLTEMESKQIFRLLVCQRASDLGIVVYHSIAGPSGHGAEVLDLIMRSNPIHGIMFVIVLSSVVLYRYRPLRRADHWSKGILPIV